MKYEYELDDLRKAYRQYLEFKYPDKSHVNITTKVGDAFFIFGLVREAEAWSLIRKSDPQLRRILIDEFLTERANPTKDSAGYLRAIRDLREFNQLLELIEEARTLRPRSIQLTLDDI